MTTVVLHPEWPVAEAAGHSVEADTSFEARAPRRIVRRVLSFLLFAAVLVVLWPAQFGGITGLTVVSGESMQPTYYTSDLVISLRQPSYAVGDVVSYVVPSGQPGAGGRVIHRILTVVDVNGAPVYTTQGDNNPSIDPWQFGSADVLGKAVASIPSIGSVFGSQSSVLFVGLACGLLVTVLMWRSGGSAEVGKHRIK